MNQPKPMETRFSASAVVALNAVIISLFQNNVALTRIKPFALQREIVAEPVSDTVPVGGGADSLLQPEPVGQPAVTNVAHIAYLLQKAMLIAIAVSQWFTPPEIVSAPTFQAC